jgi:hypothetical protein
VNSILNNSAALSALQSEMERANDDLSQRLTSWRQRMISVIHLNTALLVPWLALLAVLAVATVVLGAKAGSAWNDYRVAAEATQRIRTQGALTVFKDGRLFVRSDDLGLRSRWRRLVLEDLDRLQRDQALADHGVAGRKERADAILAIVGRAAAPG